MDFFTPNEFQHTQYNPRIMHIAFYRFIFFVSVDSPCI